MSTGQARPPDAGATPARRGRLPHASSVTVAVVVLVVGVGLSVGLASSSNAAERRALASTAREVSTQLQAAVPALQQPLRAANQLAATSGVGGFRTFVAYEVGPQPAPFRSASLWELRAGAPPRELTNLGARPELLGPGGPGAVAISRVRPSTELTLLGLLTSPVKVLGVAERLPGPHATLVVYAEYAVPPPPSPGSPLYGLDFALYFGRSTSARDLMESTMPLPARGATSTLAVPFASGTLTVLVALRTRPSGALPTALPYEVAALGVFAAALAGFGVERLVRRREAAEGVAVQRSREYDTQREIAQTLQDALRPATPTDLPGLEFATRYVAGVANLDVGGDWFDAVNVDDGRLFVTVGDVSGRGLGAATVMGSLRHATRAYAIQGDGPAEVLRKLDDLVDVRREGCFATVLCAVFDIKRGLVTVANAGHPPLLMVDTTGARFIDSHVGAPVGVPSANVAGTATLEATPGSTFFLYTDGLVERRGRSIDDGLEQLRAAAERARGTLDDRVARILGELAPEGAGDDLAVLGLRWS